MELVVRARYSPRLAGGRPGQFASENYPLRVHSYGTHEWRSQEPQVYGFPSESSAHAFEVVLRLANDGTVYAPLRDGGAYTLESVGRVVRAQALSRSTSLAFNAYATTATTDGQTCMTWVGTASIPILELLALADAGIAGHALTLVQNTTNLPSGLRQHSAVMPRNDMPLIKGAVELQLVIVRGGTVDQARALVLPPQPAWDLDALELQERALTTMQAVCDRELAAFFAANAKLGRASLPVLRRFHTVEYRPNQFFTPFIGYVLQRPLARTSTEWCLNILRVTAERRGFALVDLAAWGTSLLSPTRAASWLAAAEYAFLSYAGSTLMALANAVVYFDDCNNRNVAGMPWRTDMIEYDESNKDAFVLLGDDCEGVTKLVERSFGAIVSATMPNDDSGLSRVARLVRQTLRAYVPCYALCAATNKRLVAGSGSMNAETALAHTFCLLVPWSLFDALDKDLASRTARRGSRFYRERADELAALKADLPTLICEGTASMEPTALPADTAYEHEPAAVRAAAARNVEDYCEYAEFVHAVIDGTRLQTDLNCFVAKTTSDVVENRVSMSTFYVWLASLATQAFVDTGRVTWAATYANERYCVTFNDFLLVCVRSQRKVALTPVLTLSALESATIDNLLATTEPFPAFEIDAVVATPPPALSALRDRLATDGSTEPVADATPLHRRRIVVSCREQDLGPRELAGLEHLATDKRWRRRPTLTSYRLAAPPLPGLPAYVMIDLVLQF